MSESKSAQLVGEIAQFIGAAAYYFDNAIDGKPSPSREHALYLDACTAQKNLVHLIKAMHDEEIERVNVALDKAFGK